MTNLIDAAREGDVKLVKKLLDSGVDPDLQDHNGMTALMSAFFKGQREVAEILIPVSDLNIADWSGTKALDWAGCIPELTEMVKEHGGVMGWAKTIELPYDAPSFDKATQKVLKHFRDRGGYIVPPNQATLDCIRPDMPADLKALLHTWAHKPYSAFLKLRKGWSLERKAVGWFKEVIGGTDKDAEQLGVEPDSTFIVGMNSGGLFLAATWMEGDERMQLLELRLDEVLAVPLGELHNLVK